MPKYAVEVKVPLITAEENYQVTVEAKTPGEARRLALERIQGGDGPDITYLGRLVESDADFGMAHIEEDPEEPEDEDE